jgi:hypothetical protein
LVSVDLLVAPGSIVAYIGAAPIGKQKSDNAQIKARLEVAAVDLDVAAPQVKLMTGPPRGAS